MYDAESSKISRFDFETGSNSDLDLCDAGQLSDVDQGRYEAGLLVSGRHPVDVMWDMGESRLLTCRAKLLRHNGNVRTVSDSDSIVQVENKLTVGSFEHWINPNMFEILYWLFFILFIFLSTKFSNNRVKLLLCHCSVLVTRGSCFKTHLNATKKLWASKFRTFILLRRWDTWLNFL